MARKSAGLAWLVALREEEEEEGARTPKYSPSRKVDDRERSAGIGVNPPKGTEERGERMPIEDDEEAAPPREEDGAGLKEKACERGG